MFESALCCVVLFCGAGKPFDWLCPFPLRIGGGNPPLLVWDTLETFLLKPIVS